MAVLQPMLALLELAQTAPEALAKAIRQPPNALIADTGLSLFDGCVLCELLRREPATKDISIIVVTADESADVLARAARAGGRCGAPS